MFKMENKILEKTEFDKVTGEIYKITNAITNKHYIGQTRSHRLNRGKYRPFGYVGRFNDHISETYSNKKNTCKYLNSSIAKHGKEQFTCELLIRCGLDELDNYERRYITEYNSKYPNGYNLTDGGQKIGNVKGAKIILDANDVVHINNIAQEDPGWFRKRPRSETTKKRISENVKSAIGAEEHRNKMMKLSQTQHLEKKFEILRDVELDPHNLGKYISILKNSTGSQYIQIAFDKKRRVSFVGKHESIEDTKERAMQFMRELIKRGDTTKLREVPKTSHYHSTLKTVLEELG
jgi:hypothetical protein